MEYSSNNKVNILSGGISGFTQVIFGFPLDTLKIKAQTQHKQRITFNNVFKGLKFPLLTVLPITTIQFSLEERLKGSIDNSFITGAITGIATSPIVSITDLLRIRKQQKITFPIDYRRGQFITMMRESISFSIYFGTYNKIKTYLEGNYCGNTTSVIVSGAICGPVSWTMTYPIDIIKSRIQSYSSNTILEAIKRKRLWDGLLICNVRAVIINSIGWLVYEKSKQFIYNLY